MSLWHKRMSEVTFADIDAFCTNGPPEGTRVDYKIEVPRDLSHILAAFANTLGGLVILGVKSTGDENLPVWPPTEGMTTFQGIADRVTQFANNAYPPVPLELSALIENEHLPGTKLLVVRAHESVTAPHATDHGTRIYVRERDQNKFYRLAEVDRIEQMLDRRKGLVDLRKRYADRAVSRIERIFWPDHKYGVAWASVIPVYPWRELTEWETCRNAMRRWSGFHENVETAPEGALSVVMQSLNQLSIATMGLTLNGSKTKAVAGIEACGHVYHFHELYTARARGVHPYDVARHARETFRVAQAFYAGAEAPGYLQMTIGVLYCQNLAMTRINPDRKFGMPFRDPEFQVSTTIPYDALAQAAFASNTPEGFERILFDRLAFSFDTHFPADGDCLLAGSPSAKGAQS